MLAECTRCNRRWEITPVVISVFRLRGACCDAWPILADEITRDQHTEMRIAAVARELVHILRRPHNARGTTFMEKLDDLVATVEGE